MMTDISEDDLPISFINKIVDKSPHGMTIRSSVNEVEECIQWVTEFGNLSDTKWNWKSYKPRKGQSCALTFFCQHGMIASAKTSKNSFKKSNCSARIDIAIRPDCLILRKLPAAINFSGKHNHNLSSAEAFKYFPASNCQERFIKYFQNGMTVYESCKHHENLLLSKDEITKIELANSQFNPPVGAVQDWYEQWQLRQQNSQQDLKLCKHEEDTMCFNENPYALVIITPIMRRAHDLKSSGEIVFVVSSSASPKDHTITFLLCLCAVGAVPLSVIITKERTIEAYEKGFQLVNDALEKPFNGKGYPSLFITEDAEEVKKALPRVWPKSKQFLRVVPVLQSVWKWLWNSNHEITKEHRITLMSFFQEILYADSPLNAEQAYKNALASIGSYLPIYENFCQFIQDLWGKRELWSLAYLDEITETTTIRIAELYMKIFTDKIFSRIKTYNAQALSEFVTKYLENLYFMNMTRYFIFGFRVPRLFCLYMECKPTVIPKDKIEMFDENLYHIKGGEDVKFVNLKSGCCSCSVGLLGRFCKHQYSVFEHFPSKMFPPVSSQEKDEIEILALGERSSLKKRSIPDYCLPGEVKEELRKNTSISSTFSSFSPVRPDSSIQHNTERKQPVKDFVKGKSIPICLENKFITVKEVTENSSSPISLSLSDSAEGTCSNTKQDSKRKQIMEQLIHELSDKHNRYQSSLNGLTTFLNRLKKVNCSSDWERFLLHAGSNIPDTVTNGSYVKLQPIYILSSPLTQGSKRLPCVSPMDVPSKRRKN